MTPHVGESPGGVLLVELDGGAELFGESRLEALGRGVERRVLNELADADRVLSGR